MIYYLIYNFILKVFSPVIVFLYILRVIISGKERKGIFQRLGFFDKNIFAKESIWIHAVSVGEVVIANSLIKEIKSFNNTHKIFLSTITDTGNQMARKLVKDANGFFYLPLDFPFFINKVIKKISPKILIIVETEFWPNLLRETKKRGIKTLLVNGRISNKSFPKYKTLKFFFKEVLNYFDLIFMQSEKQKQRVIQIGANKKKVRVIGNMKFDQEIKEISYEDTKKFQREIGVSEKLIFVAGSTHPKEEEIILDCFKDLKEKFKNIILILAPRHPERVIEIEKLIVERELKSIRRTKISQNSNRFDIILVDTIGELSKIYSIADIVFVGGSLIKFGGHNILEPLFYKKVVLSGPYLFNFQEIVDIVISSGALVIVKNKEELYQKITELLNDTIKRNELGEKAKKIIEENSGSAKRTALFVKEFLSC